MQAYNMAHAIALKDVLATPVDVDTYHHPLSAWTRFSVTTPEGICIGLCSPVGECMLLYTIPEAPCTRRMPSRLVLPQATPRTMHALQP